MKSKFILLLLSVMVVTFVLTGCTTKPETDAVSGPTRANDESTFEDRISKDGTWIIITSKDLTFTKDLTVDGRFTKEGNDVPDRVLALVKFKEDGKEIVERFTVTVPNLVINSENTLIEYGIIKGDIYVQVEGFTMADATIDGNLYFATEDLKNAFIIDENSKVNGVIEVGEYTK